MISLEAPDALRENQTQLIDHTGTFDPSTFDWEKQLDPANKGGDTSVTEATKMIDDRAFREIQQFVTHQIESGPLTRMGRLDVTQSLSVGGKPKTQSAEQLIPMRNIDIPADSMLIGKSKAAGDMSLDESDYEIIAKLGEGASGIVYEARQRTLRRPVAIKVLKQRPGDVGSKKRTDAQSEELERRRSKFFHEAIITARLVHPNIVPIHDLGMNEQGEVFYSMKKIDRRSWDMVIRENAVERNIEIFNDVCDAMRFAHSQQILHRDLKPANVMVGAFNEVIVVDWGMAIDLAIDKADVSAGGTPSYMSPELANHFVCQAKLAHFANVRGSLLATGKIDSAGIEDWNQKIEAARIKEREALAKVNHLSDVYLLGAILYEIAVGHPPHYMPRDDVQNTEFKHQKEFWLATQSLIQCYNTISDPIRLSLREIAVRAMNADPTKRTQSVEALQQDLKRFQNQLQSMQLTDRGRKELDSARNAEGYQHLLPALESFREANNLWTDNVQAQELQNKAACDYADLALQRRDYDAGLSILDDYCRADVTLTRPREEKARQLLVKGKRNRSRIRAMLVGGWTLALIGFPIALFAGTWYAERSTKHKIEIAENKASQAIGQAAVKTEEAQRAMSNADTKKAQAEADLLKANNLKQAAKDTETKASQTMKEAAAKEVDAKSKMLEADRLKSLADAAQLAADALAASAARTEQDSQKKIDDAKLAQQAAEAEKLEAEAIAERSRFDAQYGTGLSLQSPIPGLLKTDLTLAKSKLTELWNSKIPDYLTHGWETHFLYQQAFGDTSKSFLLPDNAPIIRLFPIKTSGASHLVVGLDNQRIRLWKIDLQSSKSESLSSFFDLPGNAELRGCSVTENAEWLALAMTDRSGKVLIENTLVVHVPTGKTVYTNADSNTRGSGFVQIIQPNTGATNGPSQLSLISVEELAFDRATRDRLQLARRMFTVDGARLAEAGQAEFTNLKIGNRGDDQAINYLVAAEDKNSNLRLAVVAQDLNNGIVDIKVQLVESAVRVDDGDMRNPIASTLESLPSALGWLDQTSLICGFDDGTLRQVIIGEGAPPSLEFSRPLPEKHFGNVAWISPGVGPFDLITGSTAGGLNLWSKPNGADSWRVAKRLQIDTKSFVALIEGQQLLTGDSRGNIATWNPENKGQEAQTVQRVDLNEETITVAAIDQNRSSGTNATAVGTSLGRVYYYPTGWDQNGRVSRLEIQAPSEPLARNILDLDAVGVVGTTLIRWTDSLSLETWKMGSPTPKATHFDVGNNRRLNEFSPVLEIAYGAKGPPIIVTNHPMKNHLLIPWKIELDTELVVPEPTIDLGYAIKKFALSPNGRWLAAVLKKDADVATYHAVVYSLIDGVIGEPRELVAGYYVRDPVFIGFSDDSGCLALHYNGMGRTYTNPITKLRLWELSDMAWIDRNPFDTQSSINRTDSSTRDAGMIVADSQALSFLDWIKGVDSTRFLFKKGRSIYISTVVNDQPGAEPQTQLKRSSVGLGKTAAFLDGLNFVRLDTSGDQLLIGSGIDSQLDTELAATTNGTSIRRMGQSLIALDGTGIKVDFDVTDGVDLGRRPVVRRSIACTSVHLNGDVLMATYDNDLTSVYRISNSGSSSTIGNLLNAEDAKVSPDGRWLSAQIDKEVRVFDLSQPMNGSVPAFKLPVDSDWSSTCWQVDQQVNKLVCLRGKANGPLQWTVINPSRPDVPIEEPVASFTDSATGQVTTKPWILPSHDQFGNDLLHCKFTIAPTSNRFIAFAVQNASKPNGVSLKFWGTDPETGSAGWAETSRGSVENNSAADGSAQSTSFESRPYESISVSFSEPTGGTAGLATRLVVLAGPDNLKETLLFGLYSIRNSGNGDTPTTRFRVADVANILEPDSESNSLTFSSDGKLLLRTTPRDLKLYRTGGWQPGQ